MSKAKISLAGVLAFLAALGYGFIAFLGQNYLKLGDTQTALINAVLIMLSLYVLALLVRFAKKAHNNFNTMIMLERLLLVVYILLSIYLIKPFSHFFHVYAQKADIQKAVLADIRNAEGMYGEYEGKAKSRMKMYEIKLQAIISAKRSGFNPPEYKTCNFTAGNENETVITLKNILNKKLFPSNYKEIKKADSVWLMLSSSSIENWKPIAVVDVVNNLEKNISSRTEQLKGYMSFKAICEDSASITPYNPQFSFTNVQAKFKQPGQPGAISAVVALLLSILILLDYWVAKRDFRNENSLIPFLSNSNQNSSDNKGSIFD
jgi:hypothetical protein